MTDDELLAGILRRLIHGDEYVSVRIEDAHDVEYSEGVLGRTTLHIDAGIVLMPQEAAALNRELEHPYA